MTGFDRNARSSGGEPRLDDMSFRRGRELPIKDSRAVLTTLLEMFRSPELLDDAARGWQSQHPESSRLYSLVLERSIQQSVLGLIQKGASLPFPGTREPWRLTRDVESRLASLDRRLADLGITSAALKDLDRSVAVTIFGLDGPSLRPPPLERVQDLLRVVGNYVSNWTRAPILDDRNDTRQVPRWNEGGRNARSAYARPASRSARRTGREESPEDLGPPRSVEGAAQWYRFRVLASGGEWDEGINQINVVALRGRTVRGDVHSNATVGRKIYDDTIAFIWRDEQGKSHVYEFQATADPTQLHGIGEGRTLGVPQVNAWQQLTLEVGLHNGRPFMGRLVGSVPVQRLKDHNGDGVLSRGEGRPGVASLTNLHDQYSSAGCFVFPMDNATYNSIIKPIITRDSDGTFRLTVLDLSSGRGAARG